MRLSQGFFNTVFDDAFIFTEEPEQILHTAKLSADEQLLAMQVWNSDLYGEGALDACEALVEQLSDVYRWQSNSEGALIFASKILFLLRDQNRHVSWFKQNLRPARRKKRATLICPMSQDILLTVTHDNKMLLPGGLIERSELAIVAAARELYEETGLIAQHLEFLFEHKSEHYLHSVFLVHQATGMPKAQSDAAQVIYVSSGEIFESGGPSNLSNSNREILQRYLNGEGGCLPQAERRY
ncbi:NUDIX domain-containing protein [Stutzerimonas nitrititolerans]|uniref:NUDIX domain-containing protein n=1 Tax=Stutzerimonas nitrititolerans TaxID=2482751 RepID=UPI0028A5900B|nr:NUDIX domain-containing protein [Stutzerimonas nitrititolerans]